MKKGVQGYKISIYRKKKNNTKLINHWKLSFVERVWQGKFREIERGKLKEYHDKRRERRGIIRQEKFGNEMIIIDLINGEQ